MSELDLTGWLLGNLTVYGPVALALALLVGALGLPLPGSLLVVATGALARQGLVDGPSAIGLGLAGVLAGDIAGYALGHQARQWVLHRWGQTRAWQTAAAVLARRGGAAVYLTRFALTPLAIPVNLMAGGSGYPFWRYLVYDAAGELTWLVLFGGLGYLVGSRWSWAVEQADRAGTALAGAALAATLLYGLFVYRQQIAAALHGRRALAFSRAG